MTAEQSERTGPAVDAERPLIALSDLAIGYDGEVALRRLDLTVRRGDLIGVVGPSGCGKTSLLRALIGDIETYAGRSRRGAPEGGGRLRIGYVPQVETVDWNFPITVEQVALLGAWRERRWTPWAGRRARRRAREVLDQLGILQLARRPIRALSGGQQQRAFLARALISDPQLLLLDEPTSGVDIKTSHEILHELRELNAAGVTIVLTTHDLNGVASHLPRLVCLGQGTILADGTAEQVLQPELLERSYGQPMLVVQRGLETYVLPVPEEAPEAPGAHDEPQPPDAADLTIVEPGPPNA